MFATKKGQRCARGLPLRRALNEWCKLNERIAKEWGGDVPWWYNERASLSIFAGAISSSGDFAFEEFSNEKRKASPRTSKVHLSYKGRVDLYFNIQGKDFIAEAKMCWPRCGRLHPTRQKMIEKFLAHACQDIAISAPYGQRRLGMLFVAPRWKRNLKAEIDARVDAWISRISAIDCDAVSWIFPKAASAIHSYGYLYPGVAVLIKEVRRWRKSPRR
jgi:hypothetical protein